jgi:carboxyl-terminal processing protease
MKKKLLTLLSYIMVATIAVTMALSVDSVLDSVKIPGNTKLEQLENLILDKFIGDADKTAMEDAAAIAMIEALGDRWSYYISAKDYAAYMEQMNNSYVGIGVTIQQLPEGGFEITVVNPGGPAEAAGLKLGDVIVGVEGQSVLEMDAAACRDLVRGKEGTFVNLTVKRAGEEIDLAVERKTVQTAVATGEMLPGNVGLVHIVNFDARCYDETVAAIESLIGEGATALIFDVRYNPGGFKSELVKILDYLLPEGPLFHSENYLGETAVDKSDAKCLDIPMAVLVNGGSYSAAEFFAAALSEYEKAVVIGEKTTGKGHFQNTFLLADGSAVALSTGRYMTPKGVSLEGVGITPDIPVAVDEETAYYIYAGTLDPMEDPQILAAMDALKTK